MTDPTVHAAALALIAKLNSDVAAEEIERATGYIVAISYVEGRTYRTLYGPYSTAAEALADAERAATDLNRGETGTDSPFVATVYPLLPPWGT